MTIETPGTQPTIVEFVERLEPRAGDFALFRPYYCTLRRRGFGQTAALVVALLALDYSQARIAVALGCDPRRIRTHWKYARKAFSLTGPCGLVRFLEDKHAWPEGRRSHPTQQQRPFAYAPGRDISAFM